MRGKLKTMQYLLEQGANLNYIKAKTGDNALSSALYYNEYEVADWLIEQGMNLDVARELELDPKRESKLAVKAIGRYEAYLREIKPAILSRLYPDDLKEDETQVQRENTNFWSGQKRKDATTTLFSNMNEPAPLFERSDSDSSMGSLRFSFSPSDDEVEIPPKRKPVNRWEDTPLFKALQG